jgi:hypothetical protein
MRVRDRIKICIIRKGYTRTMTIVLPETGVEP